MKKWIGYGMLFLTALIWGIAFAAQSVGMDYVGPITFNGVRYIMGGMVLIPFVLAGRRKYRKSEGYSKEKEKKQIKTTVIAGLICGVCLCVASLLQQFGILYTSGVGKAGFLTALYIVLVPVFGLFIGKKNRLIIWIAVVVATVGLYLLCIKEGFKIEKGDILLLLCAGVFSVHILTIDHFAESTDGVMLSSIQFFISGILCSIAMFIFEKPTISGILSAYIPLLYTGILSCGVAYTFQILGQKYVEPAKASLILCLESVFSVLSGWVLLKQTLSIRELIGCVVMFAAIIIAQVGENIAAKKSEQASN